MNIVRALSPHAFASGDDREPQTPFFFPHVDLLIASTTALIATGWSESVPTVDQRLFTAHKRCGLELQVVVTQGFWRTEDGRTILGSRYRAGIHQITHNGTNFLVLPGHFD